MAAVTSEALTRALMRIANARPGEVRAMLWSFAYFFCLLCSYYIIRPLRDEMGVAGGIDKLPWLFTATFLVMLLAVPTFGWAVARFTRRRLIPITYRFFAANLIVFFILLSVVEDDAYVARAFFVWVSVFNLFVVSVFWSIMADTFSTEQGRRLFGFIAAGGSLGAILGPTITASLVGPLGAVNLLLISALLLEAAVQCVRRLLYAPARGEPAKEQSNDPVPPIGGELLAGITQIARSPYLLGICGYILLLTTTATVLYLEQAQIVSDAFDDRESRVRLFAAIDLAVGLLTIAVQCGVTGRLVPRIGVGLAAGLLPLIAVIGFVILALAPQIAVIVAFQAMRRGTNFAISKPAREVLYTVLSREQKYKSKNFIDTVVYRGGDALSGAAFAGLSGLGMGIQAIAGLTVPLAVAWFALSLMLGRTQERMRPGGQERNTGV